MPPCTRPGSCRNSWIDRSTIENIDINGCDEVLVTYADDRGKVRGRPIAATDDDLIQIVQNLAVLRVA